MRQRQAYFTDSVLVFLTLVALAVWLTFLFRPDNLAHFVFCDVGEGDAIVVKSPSQQYILVDGGPDNRVINCLSQSLPFYRRTLDLIVLTHPHADHVTGLIAVLKTYRVKKVVFYQSNYQSAEYREFVEEAQRQKIPMASVSTGDKISFSGEFLALVVSSPQSAKIVKETNEGALVLRFDCGSLSALLTADIPANLLEQNLGKNFSPVTILKVAHHGAKDSLNQELLDRLKPRLAVISVGAKNLFGHPHPDTLRLLSGAKIPVKRTDVDGTVEAVSDCREWWLKK